MDGNDVSTVAVKGARYVQWLTLQVGHKQRLGIRLVVGILFHDVAACNDILQVGMRYFTHSHSLLGVPCDEIAIFPHSLAQGCHIELRHRECSQYFTSVV